MVNTPPAWLVRNRTKRPSPTAPSHNALWKRLLIGVDGEGWGIDEHGRQLYPLLVAAADTQPTPWRRYLYNDGERLRTHDILQWLYDLPNGFLTGFALNYDVSMWLFDLPLEKLQELRKPSLRLQVGGMPAPWIFWEGWFLEWYPGKCFEFRPKGGQRRTIWDAYSWYQAPFLTACENSGLFDKRELEIIKLGKERRGDIEERDWKQELEYASVEMMCLSRLQRHLFETHDSVNLPLRQFHGPGSTAAVAMRQHGVQAARGELLPAVENAAQKSYIGGRFEWTKHGRFDVLYEYDIVSAYPAAIVDLPCLEHGEWHQWIAGSILPINLDSPIQLLHVYWNVDPVLTGGWGPFAVRGKDDMPTWPFSGHAWVWRCEYDAAVQWMPGDFGIDEAWSFVSTCQHKPFQFAQEYFDQRRVWKREGDGREKVYKLVLNSLYGKVCQSIGRAPFHSWPWASLITATTRARLLTAIGHNPDAVVGLATDALYSTCPLPVSIGKNLGQWESGELWDVLSVQPGFYHAVSVEEVDGSLYGITKSRARGIPDRYVDWNEFDRIWDSIPDMVARGDTDVTKWGTKVTTQRFAGIVKAAHLKDKMRLGQWHAEDSFIAFFSHKRPTQVWDGTHIVAWPSDGTNVGHTLTVYDHDIWTPERKVEFMLENHDADEWGLQN